MAAGLESLDDDHTAAIPPAIAPHGKAEAWSWLKQTT
jgi:hypothetical protein